jgi:peptidoglycan biosynthesis protein MviN/MurJ (putative lipid II flippase)
MFNCSWENTGMTIAALVLASSSYLCMLFLYCMLRQQNNELRKEFDNLRGLSIVNSGNQSIVDIERQDRQLLISR